MNETEVLIRLDENGRTYWPGGTLSGEYRIEAVDGHGPQAVEVSVLWYSEGKGDEDLGVHEFWRKDINPGEMADSRRPERFSTSLPQSPLSYDGQIVKIRWCVRVRAIFKRGRDLVAQKPFCLGNVPPARRPVRQRPINTLRRSGGSGHRNSWGEPGTFAFMSNGTLTFAWSNPFCAARLRPGTIGFVFERGEGVEQLVDALEANAWQGQITGPHGTGKSTLLAALTTAIEARGRTVRSVVISAEERRLPRGFIASLRLAAGRGLAAVEWLRATPLLEPRASQAILPHPGKRTSRGIASFGRIARPLPNHRR